MPTKEELKKQLQSYRNLKAEYQQIEEELKKVEAFMASPRGPNMSGMPSGSGSGDPMLGLSFVAATSPTTFPATTRRSPGARGSTRRS